jgi:hypothetical protein
MARPSSIFWRVTMDGGDFGAREPPVFERASEPEEGFCHSSVRTAERSRNALGGFLLKLLGLAVE